MGRLASSFGLFIGLGLIAYGLAMTGELFVPGMRPEAQLGRMALTAIAVLVLLLGSLRLLRREGLAPDVLGLWLLPGRAKWFMGGVVSAGFFMGLLAALLVLQVPFHWERGTLSSTNALLAAHRYFWNGMGEELLFRGFALVLLARYFGPRRAAFALVLPFGLFHLPGLGFSLAGLKMMVTTGAMSLLFSASFLLTRTLWTAISLHMMLNVLLHTITGLDGGSLPTLWKPVFEGPWPTGYDAPFWTLTGGATLMALVLVSQIKGTVLGAWSPHGPKAVPNATFQSNF